METDIKWLLGIMSSTIAIIVLAIIAAFRNMSTKWTTSTAALHKKIEDGDKGIIVNIDAVRKEYVRRDDLDVHVGRLDRAIQEVRAEQKTQGDEQRVQHLKVLEAIATAAGQR